MSGDAPLRVGLTGGIGSGKSTVAAMLMRLGAVLIDTDAIARELTAPGGAALPALRRELGEAILAADRRMMQSCGVVVLLCVVISWLSFAGVDSFSGDDGSLDLNPD